ncbi:hypothetical protein [Streptosporangium roseum]|uniref:hypothetical protein n=1 Tax=Streptosporangium roseum TaxID=2001 RepID=UPI0004CCBCC6|nr:hypothetical protein [Streptosporangium roseum]
MSHPTLSEQLRRIVTRHCGMWTVSRAIDALDGLVGSNEAQAMLDQLATDGLLAPRGESGDLWTMAPTRLGFTAQVAHKIRRIPEVAAADLGEDEGLIGIRTVDGDFFFVEVHASRATPTEEQAHLDPAPEGDDR